MQQDGYIVVGYVQVGSESDWRTTNTQSFKDVFTQENGYYLIFEDGQQKQENQVKAIRNLILQGWIISCSTRSWRQAGNPFWRRRRKPESR